MQMAGLAVLPYTNSGPKKPRRGEGEHALGPLSDLENIAPTVIQPSRLSASRKGKVGSPGAYGS